MRTVNHINETNCEICSFLSAVFLELLYSSRFHSVSLRINASLSLACCYAILFRMSFNTFSKDVGNCTV